MKTVFIILVLYLALLITGCTEYTLHDFSANQAAILSTDGSQVAFIRVFSYEKQGYGPMGGDLKGYSLYYETFLYTMDLSTHKLTKLAEVKYIAFPMNISWEGNCIAYNFNNTIYVINSDGTYKCSVNDASYSSARDLFALSSDGQGVFYITKTYTATQNYAVLHYANLNKNSTLFEVRLPDAPNSSNYTPWDPMRISDIMWDSSQNCLLIIDNSYFNETSVWQINSDGTNLKRSEHGSEDLEKAKQRRMGGGLGIFSSFPELEKLTKNIHYAEWGVPAPEELD